MSLKISRMNHSLNMSLPLQNLLTTREQSSSHLLSSCCRLLFVTLTVCRQHDASSRHLKPLIQFQYLVVLSISSDVCSSASLRSYASENPQCVSGLFLVMRFQSQQEFLSSVRRTYDIIRLAENRLSLRN